MTEQIKKLMAAIPFCGTRKEAEELQEQILEIESNENHKIARLVHDGPGFVSIDHGYETGDRCGRDGCAGIIGEYEKEGSCSCHIHPPCGYCVEDNHFCDSCGWSGLDEQMEVM